MNTDNMTISGETIDYGPCAFMNSYDPSTKFSSIDRNGRYAYGNQPNIGAWNLARLAETLLPLIHEDKKEGIKIAEEAIKDYSHLYHNNWIKGMRLKLGILNEESEDKDLIKELLDLMSKFKADYTIFHNLLKALSEPYNYEKINEEYMIPPEETNIPYRTFCGT